MKPSKQIKAEAINEFIDQMVCNIVSGFSNDNVTSVAEVYRQGQLHAKKYYDADILDLNDSWGDDAKKDCEKPEVINKSNDWVKINHEKTRRVVTKSNPGICQDFSNVTHFKMKTNGWLIKCDAGVVYFAKDDISFIMSACDDWTV